MAMTSISDHRTMGKEAVEAAKPDAAGNRDRGTLLTRSAGRFGAVVVSALVTVTLYFGWQYRGDPYLTPETGEGYYLGIIGGAMMLLMLSYSLRKRMRFLRRWGAVKYWFRAHMLLGIFGPLLVMFHANFQLGSVNSNVALGSMLLVAASGIVGRYIYSKIHYGLYGAKADLGELRLLAESKRHQFAAAVTFAPYLQDRLSAFEAEVLSVPGGAFSAARRAVALALRTRWTRFALRRHVRRALKDEARRAGWDARERRRRTRSALRFVAVYMATVRRVAEFSLFERLFALWHVLHVPLFLLLVIASLIHVVAVHLY